MSSGVVEWLWGAFMRVFSRHSRNPSTVAPGWPQSDQQDWLRLAASPPPKNELLFTQVNEYSFTILREGRGDVKGALVGEVTCWPSGRKWHILPQRHRTASAHLNRHTYSGRLDVSVLTKHTFESMLAQEGLAPRCRLILEITYECP